MTSHGHCENMCMCVCAKEGVSVCLGGWMGIEGQVSGLVAVFH